MLNKSEKYSSDDVRMRMMNRGPMRPSRIEKAQSPRRAMLRCAAPPLARFWRRT